MTTADITAVLLTVGEPYLDRARAAIARQTPPLAETIVVRDQTPFHRAVNHGAARVRTPYFVQVDADMALDATCCALLRACMDSTVGVVIGLLRDPLLGRVAGVKLFRTACFAVERFPDSISPDTDFSNAIARRGWQTVYALRAPPAATEPAHVFGSHAPDYRPSYTFRKFALLGARHHYRRAAQGLQQLARNLHASPHPTARIALIATAYGLLLPGERDLLAPGTTTTAFTRLEAFLAAGGDGAPPADDLDRPGQDARTAFCGGYAYGVALHRARAPAAFLAALDRLAARLVDAQGPVAWAALAGLCQGLFTDAEEAAAMDTAFTRVNTVLPAPFRERGAAPVQSAAISSR